MRSPSAMAALPGLLALVLLAFFVTQRSDRVPAAGVHSEDGSATDDGRALSAPELAAAQRRIRELEDRVDQLEEEAVLAPVAIRTPAAPGPGPATGSPQGKVVDHDGRWYLTQYVQSFRESEAGSEFFRLGVDAHMAGIVTPVLGLAKDVRSHPVLRRELIKMLGRPSLKGQNPVVVVLLDVLMEPNRPELGLAAIASLRVLGDASKAPIIEARLWRVHAAAREPLLDLLLFLVGDRANEALARLLRTAPDQEATSLLIARVKSEPAASALACIETGSHASQPVRVVSAHVLGTVRGDAALAMVDSWLKRETDKEVIAALGRSRSRLSSVPSWAPEQATGAPNVANIQADSSAAWASQQQDSGNEWLQLGYKTPMRAHAINVHEVLVGGAVARISLMDTSGGWHNVWTGTEPETSPGLATFEFPLTPYRTKAVRLELDTTRGSGWNEIDAVQLVGPAGAAWAVTATASSYYGAGSH